MIRDGVGKLGRLMLRASEAGRARPVPSLKIVQATAIFSCESANTYLISFPRTGSHWLRMLVEKYLQRPLLTMTYYYTDREDYLIYHTHDLALDISHSTVVYLYRDPVETIYSQMIYHQLPLDDLSWIAYWTRLYAMHLKKWLCDEGFTRRKTLIRYDRLRDNSHQEFAKIAAHFGVSFEADKYEMVFADTTRDEVARKRSAADLRVVNMSSNYALSRQQFVDARGQLVWDLLLDEHEKLASFFVPR
jgi:hypothetical protein